MKNNTKTALIGRPALALTGLVFGKLTVARKDASSVPGRHIRWLCICECGTEKVAASSDLKNGNTSHCGCVKRLKHGQAVGGRRSPIAKVWSGMMQRCYNAKNKNYHHYGGRGIVVSDEWHDLKQFVKDMSPRPKNMTIERIDTNRGYSKENCRWVTQAQQTRNRRVNRFYLHAGAMRCIAEIAELENIKYFTLYSRLIKLGKALPDAIAMG